MIFGINTTYDISKLSQISLAKRLMKLRKTVSKYHSWYLCQISQLITLLPIQILHKLGSKDSYSRKHLKTITCISSGGGGAGMETECIVGDSQVVIACRCLTTNKARTQGK